MALMPSAHFKKIYQRLNQEQKKAVDTIEGPVMVVAGPGTGKTQVLAARIANILLKTDTNPTSILALTFTESAAKEMRQRLVKMIGQTGYYVQISTFHAFCSQVIKTHPEYFPIDRDSEPLTDLERYDIFQKIIDDARLETIKPLNSPYFYLRDIMFAISNLKREGFLPADFAKIVTQEKKQLAAERDELTKTKLKKRERNLNKWRELITVYEKYQKRLRAKLRYDFDDMIALVVEAFAEHELLLREYQENLHYFLVDEYQDTNNAQNQVVDLLASYWGEQANVFVVGDPNQSIYRFQGASVENVLGFAQRYSQAEIITLEKGYRCPANLYQAAARSIRHNKLTELGEELADFSHGEPLSSQQKTSSQSSLRLYTAPSQTLETVFVAEEITRLVESGVPLDQIAVLYRHNRDATEIQEVLDKWNLRYELDGGDDLLQNEAMRQLLTLLTVIDQVRSGQEDERLFEVMRYEWLELNQTLVMRAGRAAGKAKLSLAELIEAGYKKFAQYDLGEAVKPLEFEELTQFLSKLRGWGALDGTVVFPQWFETVVKESGFLDWVLSGQLKSERLLHLNSLFREVKALAQSKEHLNLKQFLAALETMRDHGIKVNVEDLNVKKDSVHLSTVHRAKGQEWQHVFLLHCLDGKWGNNRHRELLPLPENLLQNTDLSKKEQNEDERRLFYVALTRASQQATITYPETIVTDNRSKEVVGSMFIEELRAEDELEVELETVTAPKISQEADQYLARLIEPAPEQELEASEEKFFQALVDDFSLSVTALNTYLRAPEDFVENVLLRVPRAKPEPMVFGSAVHAALETMFKPLVENQDDKESEERESEKQKSEKQSLARLGVVLSQFETALQKEIMTIDDFERRLAYGKDVLTDYYQAVQEQGLAQIQPLFIERFCGYGWSKTMLGDIHLTGRIDRVDWLDQEQRLVRVIDYKTGRAKSKNFIEGKIASAGLSAREQELPETIKGPYKRQLLFYKLLTDLDETFIPTVTEGMFDFVEPNSRGKFVQRNFVLSDEAVNNLKELIKEVMAEIRDLKFLELV